MNNFWLGKAKRRNLVEFLTTKFGHRKFIMDGVTDAEAAEIGEAFFAHKDYQDNFGWYIDEEGAFHVVDSDENSIFI